MLTATQKAQIAANDLAAKKYAGTSQTERASNEIASAKATINGITQKGQTGNVSQLQNNIVKDQAIVNANQTAGQKQEAAKGGKLSYDEFSTGGYQAAGGYQGYVNGSPLIGAGQQLQFGDQLKKQIENQPKNDFGNLISDAQKKAEAEQTARNNGLNANAPTPPKPPDEGYKTNEERLQADLAYQQSLADYYKTGAQKMGTELTGVSGQVADFGAKLAEFQKSNSDAISTLNNYLQGLGDRVSNVAAGIDGAVADINDYGIQSQIQNVISGGGSVQDQNKKIEAILTNSSGTDLSANTANFTSPTNITPQVSSNPLSISYQPLQMTAEGEMGNFYNTSTPDTYSVLDMLKSTNPSGQGFTSADLSLMALQNSIFSIQQSKEKLEQNYNERKTRINTDTTNFLDVISKNKTSMMDMLTIMKDEAKRQISLKENQIQAEKDTKMKSLARKTERMESFIKAQMEWAGIPIEGQMGLTVLSNAMANWNDSVSTTENQYNNQLVDLQNKQTDLVLNYSSKVLELNKDYTDKQLTIFQNYNTQIDKIDSDETLSNVQYDMLKSQSINDYLKTKATEESQLKMKMLDQAFETKNKMFDLQSNSFSSAGYVPIINEDGSVGMMFGEDGKPVLNIDAQRLYNEMNKGQVITLTDEDGNQHIEIVNPYTKQRTILGSTNPNTGLDWGGTDTSGGQTFNIGGTPVSVGSDWSKLGLPGADAECVGFGRFCAPDLPTGLWTIDDKRKVYSSEITDPTQIEIGDTLFSNSGDFVATSNNGQPVRSGHVMTVIDNSKLSQGVLSVIDANFDNDPNASIIKTRDISVSDIDRDPATQRLGVFRSAQKRITGVTAQESVKQFDYSTASEINQFLQSGGKDYPYYAKTKSQKEQFRNLANNFRDSLEDADIETVLKSSIGGKNASATMSQQIQKSLNVITNLEELNKTITGEKTGPIWGAIRSKNPYDTKAQLIKSQLTAIVPNLARGVYGEVGVLTDEDVKLYSRTLPNLESKEDLRNALLSFTLRVTRDSLATQMKTYARLGYDVSEMAPLFSELNSRIEPLEKSLNIMDDAKLDSEYEDFYNKLP